MQNTSISMLVNAAGQLMQQHAFDHLPDEKLSRIRQSFQRLANEQISNEEKRNYGNELLDLCSEADLFNETVTPQGMQQWFAVMNCFGMKTERSYAGLHEESD